MLGRQPSPTPIYICIYPQKQTHTHTHTLALAHTHTHTHTHTHAHTHTRTHTHTHTQMSKLFMNDYSNGEIFKSAEVYNNQKLPNVLTLHSFKDPEMMHRIHQYYIEVAIGNSMSRTKELENELERVSKHTNRERAFA